MNSKILAPLFVCTLAGLFITAFPQAAPRGCSPCLFAQQALDDLEHVKIGMPRSELDKYFELAGGMTFRDHTRYESRRCDYIQVEVDFSIDRTVDRDFSPRDTITKISRLFVVYPGLD